MDPLAVVLLRRTARVAVPTPGPVTPDGAAWVAALEADLADRGWLLHHELRSAAARLPHPLRVRWADWLLATVEELVGADRTMVPLYRAFPDTPRDTEAVYVRRLLTHLLAVPGAPCVLCGRDEGGEPLDPCGHLVCRACFPPEEFSACPICGRRLAAGTAYLPMVAPGGRPPAGPPIRVRLLRLEPDLAGAAAGLRDELVARPGALSEADRADLAVLVRATAPADLGWLPDTVPARETLAVVLAWALHATALTPAYPAVLAEARRRWQTATDAARTLWAYSGGDPGLILPARADEPYAPNMAWRPVDEPATPAPVTRVRALPRALRGAVLAHLDACGAGAAAEDLRRHPAVWKRLGERLHPYERVADHPGAAVAFATLRGTRTARESALGAAIMAACAADPRRLVPTSHDDGTVTARVRTHAALVEEAFATGAVDRAAGLLAERPGELWRRVDHLLRASDDPAAVMTVLRESAGRVAPGVLAAAAAELTGRDTTVAASEAQLAAVARARRAGLLRARGAEYPVATPAAATTAGAPGAGVSASAVVPGADGEGDAGIVGGRPGPGMPRRVFFPRGSTVTTWTEPEVREPLSAAAIAPVRTLVDGELARRAARLGRFDVAVIDAALAQVPAPMRERAASAQLAGWPRGSIRALPDVPVLRLFLHWQGPGEIRVDLDLSCAFFDADWRRLGHCDYTQLRFAADGAVHSGDLTSAPAPLGATEFLDLRLSRLVERGVRYAVPVVLSFDAVPFALLTEAFAGLMLPLADGAQFDAARVEQRFDLRGDARMLLPMVVDLTDRRLLWTDLTLPGHGYGHSVGRHGDQLARAAADQWEHFAGGNRASLLDLMAWQAAGRADRVLVAHADGTCTQTPPTVAAIRAAAAAVTGAAGVTGAAVAAVAAGAASAVDGAHDRAVPAATGDGSRGRTVLAATTDGEALLRLIPGPVAAGSVALTVTGHPGEPWTQLHAPEAMGLLAVPE